VSVHVWRRFLAVAAATTMALAAPATASAHAGLTRPVASDYVAIVTGAPPGVAVRVVDGDQQLWMSVNPRLSVIVLGLRGEPYLRFSPHGVDENLRSPTVYLNRPVPAELPPGLGAGVRPQWRRLTGAHSYMWYENRLQALALGAHRDSPGSVGAWVIPMVVDGRRTQVRGRLDFQPRPTRLWLWPVVVGLASIPAVLRLQVTRFTRRLVRILALIAVPAVIVGRVGRELYGHPGVALAQMIDLAATGLLGVLLIAWLLRGRRWEPAALIASVLAVYEGVLLLPTLERGFVLAVDPAVIERSAASVCLAAGLGGLLSIVFLEAR
jgi:hypothetical protein